MDKPAPTEYQLHPLIRERWSPRAFGDALIDDATLRSLLEAARWAPSCFNEQPWRFVVARRNSGREFSQLLSCLTETNQIWAKHAAVLMLSVASTTFAHNAKPNRHALHDVGLAVAQLTVQATSLGLAVHQMAGFSQDKARTLYGIPDHFEPATAIAIGHPSSADQLPDELRQRELAARARHGQDEFVFTGSWGRPF